MKVCAVVVTYNRLSLLKYCIESLRDQTYPLDSIIVVNNNSTDGTKEYLDIQSDIIVINQENLGGAGGFYAGSKFAYSNGYDWIWMMDDDVAPSHDCLENLLKHNTPDLGIIQPLRIFNNTPVLMESKVLNVTNYSLGLHQCIISDLDIDSPCYVNAIPFEGPLIKKEVFSNIGFPNKEFFIFYDDTDFSIRTIMAGFKIKLVPNAKLNKMLLGGKDTVSLSWKKCYELRNAAYFDRIYGKTFSVRFLRPLKRAYGYIRYCYNNNPDMSLKIACNIMYITLKGLCKKMGKI